MHRENDRERRRLEEEEERREEEFEMFVFNTLLYLFVCVGIEKRVLKNQKKYWKWREKKRMKGRMKKNKR
jgi:hypothetical protein